MAQQIATVTLRIVSAANLVGMNIDGTSNVFFTVELGREASDVAKTRVIEDTVQPTFDEKLDPPMVFKVPLPVIATIRAFNQVPFSETLSDLIGVATISFLLEEAHVRKTIPLTHGGDVALANRAMGGCGTVVIEYTVSLPKSDPVPTRTPTLVDAQPPLQRPTEASRVTERAEVMPWDRPPTVNAEPSPPSHPLTAAPTAYSQPSEPAQPPTAVPTSYTGPPTPPPQPPSPPPSADFPLASESQPSALAASKPPPPPAAAPPTAAPTANSVVPQSTTAAPQLSNNGATPSAPPNPSVLPQQQTMVRPGPLPAPGASVTFTSATSTDKASLAAKTHSKGPSPARSPSASTQSKPRGAPSSGSKRQVTANHHVNASTDGVDVSPKLLDAARAGAVQPFSQYRASDVLLKGPLLELRDYAGRSVLHLAAWYGHIAVLHELLRPMGGTNTPVVDWARHLTRSGNTVLHTAAEAGRVEVIEWLLQQRSAQVHASARNLRGETPGEAAILYCQPTASDILFRFVPNELRVV